MTLYRSAVTLCISLFLLLTITVLPQTAKADDSAPAAITACLTAFESHPFSSNPEYRTLPVKVKVFGIGKDTIDNVTTAGPELVYIRAGVNVAGGSLIQLNDPNGWYCMRTAVNVMGGLTIKLACNAKFVMLGGGATALGSSTEEQLGTTVMGGTQVERECG